MAQRPFEHADPERIVCRFDVSSVFDEDEDEHEDEHEDEDEDHDEEGGADGSDS